MGGYAEHARGEGEELAHADVYVDDDGPRAPTDRELIEEGLRLAKLRRTRVGHERQG
jgi:hypothetical protein